MENSQTKEEYTTKEIINENLIKNDKIEQPQSRQSNFELLRIIAMFLIVLHHASLYGTLTSNNDY